MKVILGMGCDRGTSQSTLESAIDLALQHANLTRDAVHALATIDKKKDEIALLSLSSQHDWPLNFYSANQLAAVKVPNPSEVVRKYMGTPAVAEAAAMLAANTDIKNLIVEKIKYLGQDKKNATVSIVRINMNNKENQGKILLVGFGPGAEAHMSVRALQAIKEAHVVIGYSTYIKLVKNLLEGKEVIRKGMTEEIDRCIEAYEQAQLGKTVALISSGDIGVYGMAGPTYEVLLKSGWKPGCGIEVEIIPGSTALSACASLVGAPLTHDFCSISLSDLLTPWPTIAKRIDAAGRSDFVVALYNPKSGRRTQQIVEAQRILLQYRKAETPVAIVKSAYREAQNIQMVRLDEMKDCKIGMLTTVLIGNSSTYIEHDLMITPRGYANKYKDITGDAIEGEQRGRSLSMGLIGWKACVREYLRTSTDHSLRDVSLHFDSPTGEIISAISEAKHDDIAGEYSAAQVQQNTQSVIEAAKQWDLLRAVVRSDAGAVSELMVHAKDFTLRGDWLNIENEHFHLHVNWASIQQAWFIRRGDKLCGVHFTNEQNETVFNLSLVRKERLFNKNALQAFEQDWQTLTEIKREIASNE